MEVKIPLKNEIGVEFWGDLACFSPPWAKVERMTYPFPTPSAARGMLSAIYSKPIEFHWQITRIEVLNPIHYISFRRNEVKCKVSDKPIATDEERTQRNTTALQDVHYRIFAEIVLQKGFTGSTEQLYEQARRRIRMGKCFYQPAFGCREFVAYFSEIDETKRPIQENLDAGLMVYDVFDLHDCSVQKKTKTKLTLFHAVMENGVIHVPPYDSPEVIRGGM